MSNDSSNTQSAKKKRANNVASRNVSQFWQVPWRAPMAFASTLLIIIFSYGAVGVITDSEAPSTNLALAVVYAITGVLTVVGVGYLVFAKRMKVSQFIGERPRLSLPLVVFVAYILYVEMTWIALKISQVVFGVKVDQEQSFGFDGSYTLSEKAVIFIALVVIAPIAEELLYRGVLYRGLRRSWGRWIAAVVTSLIFGAMHGQWNVGVDTFVLSIILIGVMEYTESLWGPILLHSLKNGVAFLIVYSGLVASGS